MAKDKSPLFPESTIKGDPAPLVNQTPDDGIPFEPAPEREGVVEESLRKQIEALQQRIDKNAETMANMRNERDNAFLRVDDIQKELEAAHAENAKLAKQIVSQGERHEQPGTQSMAEKVFIAIINGMAAHGDFTSAPGRPSMNDASVQNMTRHAAGIAQFAAMAAKQSRI